ncbi:Hypothetical predicted protein [Cloeon dipterum]|uniref:Uncharacterized protein n=1 Tax=Cloeon dipterum TaxID=197152 RepID=A0A8S1C894_9INSE|nr:Hypothetical predicted protein [Cloeon dipterum]
MGPVSTLGLLLLLVACASCASNENYGINLFKDYLRNGKEYETILNGEIPPKYLYFYRASPSLLLPEGGGTKRNQFWRSVGRREVEEDGPLEFPDVARGRYPLLHKLVHFITSSAWPLKANTFRQRHSISVREG